MRDASEPRPSLPLVSVLLCALVSSCVPADEVPARRTTRSGSHASGGESADDGTPRENALPETGPLELTVEKAILASLQNNRSLRTERLSPAIRRTYVDQERAAFDPVISAEISKERTKTEGSTGSRSDSTADTLGGGASVSAFLPTGTSVTADAEGEKLDSSLYSDEASSATLGLTVTQALLNGAGVRANLASLRQARLDTFRSQWELRGFTEALVAEVETTYWDYVLAERQIQIYTDSLELAEKQLGETRERIKVGGLPETELASAQAEVAGRREQLINARSALVKTRLRLLRLLNPAGDSLWSRSVTPKTAPEVPEATLDSIEKHVQVALRMRPDLNQAMLDIERGRLDVVKTRNGLLPKLDLFVSLGRTGYASSFGDAVEDLDGDSYGTRLGVLFEVPLGNRDARARHARAWLSLDQTRMAVANMTQLAELDVRTAHVEAGRAREQITATAATRKLKEEVLRSETEKFRVGRSTSILVAGAQRDLVVSRIAEVEAIIGYLKALIDLYRLEGSLLNRRGIQVQDAPSAISGTAP